MIAEKSTATARRAIDNDTATVAEGKEGMMGKTWLDHFTDFGIPEEAFDLLRAEDKRQIKKWGEQSHTPAEWLMFLTEECGELAEAIAEWWYREGSIEEVQKEAVQVATLAFKIAVMSKRS